MANRGYNFGWQGSEHSVFIEATFLILGTFRKRCSDNLILFPVVLFQLHSLLFVSKRKERGMACGFLSSASTKLRDTIPKP